MFKHYMQLVVFKYNVLQKESNISYLNVLKINTTKRDMHKRTFGKGLKLDVMA